MGPPPTKALKYVKFKSTGISFSALQDYFTVDAMATSSRVSWSFWTTYNGHKLLQELLKQEDAPLGLCYTALKQND